MSGPVFAIFTGDREWDDAEVEAHIRAVIASLPPGSVVMHGAARGIDFVVDRVALELGYLAGENLLREPYLGHLGRAGGPVRNLAMAHKALAHATTHRPVVYGYHRDIASSKGTKNMLQIARRLGIPYECYPEGQTLP